METNTELNELVKTAQQMQVEMKKVQKNISELEVIGDSGNGEVKITMTGQHQAKQVILEPDLLKKDKKAVENFIVAAINDATNQIEKETREALSGLKGIKLPIDSQK